MPPSIALSSYTLRVNDKSANEYVKMNEINQLDDALEIFQSFLNHSLENTVDEDSSKKLFQISKYQLNKNYKTENTLYRMISGIVKSGSYGYESDIVQKTGGSVSHHRTTEEAEMLPFYFLVAIPNDKNEGIVILQTFKQFGIKRIFTESFDNYFRSKRPEYEIEINDLVPEKLFKQLLETGVVANINYTRFNQHVDLPDAVDTEDHKEERDLKAELILTGKRGILTNVVRSVKNKIPIKKGQDDDPFRKLIEVTPFKDFEYDVIKIKMRVNGKYRTIDLVDLENMKPTVNITEEVTILSSGHPDFDSIDQIAMDLFKDLARGLGVEN